MASKATARDIRQLYDEIKQQVDDLTSELAAAQFKLDSLTCVLEMLEGKSGTDGDDVQPKQIRNELVEILADLKHPVHYGELLGRLKDRGLSVGGKDPLRNIAAHLSNDERFRSSGNGLWGLASWTAQDGRKPLANSPITVIDMDLGERVTTLRDRVRQDTAPHPNWAKPPSHDDDESAAVAVGQSSDSGPDNFDDVPF